MTLKLAVATVVILEKKILPILMKIWFIGRGRRVMHVGMQHDPIQGQGQGHEPLKVENSTIFDGYLFSYL